MLEVGEVYSLMKSVYAFDVSKLKMVSKEPDLNKRSVSISVILVQIYSLPLYHGNFFILSFLLSVIKSKLGFNKTGFKKKLTNECTQKFQIHFLVIKSNSYSCKSYVETLRMFSSEEPG